MKNEPIIQGALAGLLAAGIGLSNNMAMAAGVLEKCAGIARAGQNDCGTRVNSCAATARTDREAEAWVWVPQGTCARIFGGKIQTSPFARPGGKSGIAGPAAVMHAAQPG